MVLGARVLAEFRDVSNRYADAKSRKNYAGASPVTRASGKHRVLARYPQSPPQRRLLSVGLRRPHTTPAKRLSSSPGSARTSRTRTARPRSASSAAPSSGGAPRSLALTCRTCPTDTNCAQCAPCKYRNAPEREHRSSAPERPAVAPRAEHRAAHLSLTSRLELTVPKRPVRVSALNNSGGSGNHSPPTAPPSIPWRFGGEVRSGAPTVVEVPGLGHPAPSRGLPIQASGGVNVGEKFGGDPQRCRCRSRRQFTSVRLDCVSVGCQRAHLRARRPQHDRVREGRARNGQA